METDISRRVVERSHNSLSPVWLNPDTSFSTSFRSTSQLKPWVEIHKHKSVLKYIIYNTCIIYKVIIDVEY